MSTYQRASTRTILPALLLALLFTAACGGGRRSSPTPTIDEFSLYLPATSTMPLTPVVFITPTPTLSKTSVMATEANCTNVLSFLNDVTVPDGTQFSPGAAIDKRWKVENSGSCTWDERYKVRLIEGPDLGAAKEQPLYPARAGTQAEIAIQFTAPSEPGTYRSAWQAVNPNGDPFGDMFYIEVVVK